MLLLSIFRLPYYLLSQNEKHISCIKQHHKSAFQSVNFSAFAGKYENKYQNGCQQIDEHIKICRAD